MQDLWQELLILLKEMGLWTAVYNTGQKDINATKKTSDSFMEGRPLELRVQ